MNADIITIGKNINVIETDIDQVNNIFSERMNKDRNNHVFRQWISAIFGILIFFIIGGFFLILYTKGPANASSVLMGEAGLQFITLFSIIIAIVLFGVLNILEGRELSAIISGISGFILGKYNPNRGAGSNAPAPVSPEPPVQ